MRDVKRLDNFYNELKQIHKTYFPDWRFGQLISNFLSYISKDCFYWEEDRFIEELNKYVETVNASFNKRYVLWLMGRNSG